VLEAVPQTAVRSNARFEDGITLVGFEAPEEVTAGRSICTTIYWQTDGRLTADVTVFLHLAAEDGFVQAQDDAQPVFGYYPTGAWQPGEVVADLHCLVAPPGLNPGIYTLRTGLYDAASGERLQLLDPASRDNALELTELVVNRGQ
jgi:hypothetical protein